MRPDANALLFQELQLLKPFRNGFNPLLQRN